MPRRLVALLSLVVIAVVVSAAQEEEPSVKKLTLDEWIVDLFSRAAPIALAVPELEAASADIRIEASEVSRILFDDIAFASVFQVVPRDRYALAGKTDPLDYDGWRSIGADIVVTGTVSKARGELVVELKIHALVNRVVPFASRYATRGSTRQLAHFVADSIVGKLVGIAGVSRTEIAFASSRVGGSKALFLMDYDGHGQRALTHDHHLDFQPRFGNDRTSLSYISYRRKNDAPVLAVANGPPIFEGPGMIFSASWSPDGTHIAFSSTRDEPGNAEIYVMRRDGTDVRRLTHHPAIDVSPTWSPTGREIAFTSDRAGSPQVYTMDAEGLSLRRISMKGSYNAEPAWSPSTAFSEIAYATRIGGAVFEIVVHDLEANEIRFLTNHQGLNESPQWAPNGRHLVFTSTRTGTPQIFTMNRDGSNQRQLTFDGENTTPTWGPLDVGTADRPVTLAR